MTQHARIWLGLDALIADQERDALVATWNFCCPKPYRATRFLRFPILASAHLLQELALALARSDWLSTG